MPQITRKVFVVKNEHELEFFIAILVPLRHKDHRLGFGRGSQFEVVSTVVYQHYLHLPRAPEN